MDFLKELLLRLTARFAAILIVAGFFGGIATIFQSCYPGENDLGSTSEFSIGNQ